IPFAISSESPTDTNLCPVLVIATGSVPVIASSCTAPSSDELAAHAAVTEHITRERQRRRIERMFTVQQAMCHFHAHARIGIFCLCGARRAEIRGVACEPEAPDAECVDLL